MSADCCCDRGPCSDEISACCIDTPDGKGACIQVTECECRKKNGSWKEPTTTQNGTVTPASCDECYICQCCGTQPKDGLYEFRGQPYKKHIRDFSFRCPPDTVKGRAFKVGADGKCGPNCNVNCDSKTGACCYDCGCVEGLTKCSCLLLQYASGPGTQFENPFVEGSSCASKCASCACIGGVLSDVASLDCVEDFFKSNQFFFAGTSCTELMNAYGSAGYANIVAECTKTLSGGGGGGGGGVPVVPSIPPRPITPPPPPRPCTRPPVYNPTCSYKVWFVVYSKRTEDPCYNRVEEVINLYRLPDFSTDSCNTLGCCGAPAPDCTDVEAMVVPTEFKRVTNCTFGDTDTQIGTITLKCNDEQVFQRYENPCDPCPDSRVEKLKIVCNTAQFLRGCCDTKMNFLQFQIPETGIKVNGVWTLYYPAETVILDLRNRVCEGYDRNHPSCK